MSRSGSKMVNPANPLPSSCPGIAGWVALSGPTTRTMQKKFGSRVAGEATCSASSLRPGPNPNLRMDRATPPPSPDPMRTPEAERGFAAFSRNRLRPFVRAALRNRFMPRGCAAARKICAVPWTATSGGMRSRQRRLDAAVPTRGDVATRQRGEYTASNGMPRRSVGKCWFTRRRRMSRARREPRPNSRCVHHDAAFLRRRAPRLPHAY